MSHLCRAGAACLACACLLSSCSERRRVQLRLVGASSCTTLAAQDAARGLGPSVIPGVRALRVVIAGDAVEGESPCVAVGEQTDADSLSLALRAPVAATPAFRELAAGQYTIRVVGTRGTGCARQGTLVCGEAAFSLPPQAQPIEVLVHCYDERADTGQPQAGPPASFAACASSSPPTPDAGPPPGDGAPPDLGADRGPADDGPALDGPALDGPSLPCSADRWCRHTAPPGQYHAVWGRGRSDVFAVGEGGLIAHFDGASWSPLSSGITGDLYAVWGTASEVLVAGAGGAMLSHTTGSWRATGSGTTKDILGLWTSDTDGPYIVAKEKVYRYDGAAWSALMTNNLDDLLGVWVSSDGKGFTAGKNGTALYARYPGDSLSPLYTATTKDLHGVWGAAGDDVFFVGGFGTILRYTGNSMLTTMAAPSGDSLYAVGGSGPALVFAVGESGVVHRFDGAKWVAEQSGVSARLHGVWADAQVAVAVGEASTVLVRALP